MYTVYTYKCIVLANPKYHRHSGYTRKLQLWLVELRASYGQILVKTSV